MKTWILLLLCGAMAVAAATGWTVQVRLRAGQAEVVQEAGGKRLVRHLLVSQKTSPGVEQWRYTVQPLVPGASGQVTVIADPGWAPVDPAPVWHHDHDRWVAEGMVPPTRFEADVLTGRLEPLGMTIQMQGTHQLMGADGQVMALLQGDGVDLHAFEGQPVEVVGRLGRTVEGGRPFLTVRQVRPVH